MAGSLKNEGGREKPDRQREGGAVTCPARQMCLQPLCLGSNKLVATAHHFEKSMQGMVRTMAIVFLKGSMRILGGLVVFGGVLLFFLVIE